MLVDINAHGQQRVESRSGRDQFVCVEFDATCKVDFRSDVYLTRIEEADVNLVP